MRRLDGLSALIVYNDRPRYYMHTLKVAIVNYGERPKPDYETVITAFEDGIRFVPMLKWKLAFVPLGINHPLWVQDTEFDIRYHVRYVQCPAPGDERALSALISQLYAYPMDKSVPLWMSWIVDGLEGGRRAVVTLLHHAYTDGAGASLMLDRIFAPERHQGCPVAQMDPHEEPSKLRLFWDGLVDLPKLFIREIPPIMHGLRVMREYNKECKKQGLDKPPTAAETPYTPFNTKLTHRRTFVYKIYPLQDIREISKRLKVTINDLFVAVSAGAFRRYFKNMPDSDYDPDSGPMVCTLPMNGRPPAKQDDLVGNMVINASMWVPVHIADPALRLKYTHEKAQTMKAYLRLTRDANLFHVMGLLPPLYGLMLERRADRGRLKNMFGNATLSNVVGPREHFRFGDATLENWLSIGQVSLNTGLNITVWSYAENFNLCVMADPSVVPDGWELIDLLTQSLEEYRVLDPATVDVESS